jgi:hypothetical protein
VKAAPVLIGSEKINKNKIKVMKTNEHQPRRDSRRCFEMTGGRASSMRGGSFCFLPNLLHQL